MHWWLHIVWAATHPTCSSCASWVCTRVMTLPGPGRVKHFKVGEVCGFKLTLVAHLKGLDQGGTSELWWGNERTIACLCLKEELKGYRKLWFCHFFLNHSSLPSVLALWCFVLSITSFKYELPGFKQSAEYSKVRLALPKPLKKHYCLIFKTSEWKLQHKLCRHVSNWASFAQ